jgi:hypothetical protein
MRLVIMTMTLAYYVLMGLSLSTDNKRDRVTGWLFLAVGAILTTVIAWRLYDLGEF